MSEKLNFTTPLHKCCVSDKDGELRPAMLAVHFLNGYAYATNSHVLVKCSLEYHQVLNPEKLEGKAIHKDNFKEILKFEIVECCDDGISCKNADGQIAFYEYFDLKGQKVPDFESIIPKNKKYYDTFKIRINPKMLSICTSAMYSGNDGFRLRFTGLNSAIVVDSIGFDNQIGIVMPVILRESIF
jgi:hypothetical protein